MKITHETSVRRYRIEVFPQDGTDWFPWSASDGRWGWVVCEFTADGLPTTPDTTYSHAGQVENGGAGTRVQAWVKAWWARAAIVRHNRRAAKAATRVARHQVKR